MKTTISISKGAEEEARYARPIIPFESARAAFFAYMQGLGITAEDEVLLPAYIGWSPNEGSGVFDPVRQIGARFAFYPVTRALMIDADALHQRIEQSPPRLLVLIHYFGFPDPNAVALARHAQERGVLVLEDKAHAFYSDWIGGVCGRAGDAVIMSLHKMLPLPWGGLLQLNGKVQIAEAIRSSPLRRDLDRSPLEYDLVSIAAMRRRNAQILLDLLRPLAGAIEPLFALVPDGVIPQTLPVIIYKHSRDDLYFELNRRGYGVVSLYHTLIQEIDPINFPESHWLARHLLNLPVHQDVAPEALMALVAQLSELLIEKLYE